MGDTWETKGAASLGITVSSSTTTETDDNEDETGAYPLKYLSPDFEFGTSINSYLSDVVQGLTVDAMIINQITGYLSSAASAAISDIIRSTGIAQLQNTMTLIKNEYNSVKSLFTTDLNFSGADSIDGALNASVDVLSRAEKIVDTIENVEKYATDIINHVNNAVDFITDLPDKIAQEFENFQNTLETLANLDLSAGIDNLLNNLPDSVLKSVLNLDIIKDPLLLFYNIQSTISTITTVVANLKCPANLNDVRALLALLRGIVAQLKAIKSRVDRIKNQIEQIAKIIQNGDYISMLMSLASGGIMFLLKPIMYNAVYPCNKGWTTPGGFRQERDDTPNACRIGLTHPKGTRVDINPDGSGTVKVGEDFQISIDKNLDVLVKGAATINVQGGEARIIGESVTVESKGNATITAANALINARGVASVNTLPGGSVSVVSGGTCSVTSVGATEVSAGGLLTLNAKANMNIFCPGLLTITAGSILQNVAGTTTYNSVGPFKVNSTVIGLN